MTDEQAGTAEPASEAEALLPWYLNGTLSPEETALVERALAEDPALRAELEQLTALSAALRESSDAVAVPAGDFDDLMARIEAEEPEARARAQVRATPARGGPALWLDGLREAFAFPAMRFAGIAAALAIMIQGAVIVGLVQDDGPAGFRTAVAPTGDAGTEAKGPRLILVFQDSATQAEIAALLLEIGGQIVAGPGQEGAYTVELQGAAADVDGLLADLKTRAALIRRALKGS